MLEVGAGLEAGPEWFSSGSFPQKRSFLPWHCCLCYPSAPSCTGILPAPVGSFPATLGTRCGTALGLLWTEGVPHIPSCCPRTRWEQSGVMGRSC